MSRTLLITLAMTAATLPAVDIAVGDDVDSVPATGSELYREEVPYTMDSSNQAGWWHPVAEFGGSTYVIFNSPAEVENRHEVHVAKRSPSGEWTAGCLQDAGGTCVTYGDDIGHNQPSLAIDGDGYLHAFVSMHNDPWRYFRSEDPESVTTVVDHSADMPDQEGGVTYPVTATAPNGNVYLMARVNVPVDGHTGRLYEWSVERQAWSREAIFTPGHVESGYVPYPDDLTVDHRGDVHILWEWARGRTSNLRYYGSYLIYQPQAERFVDAGGTEVTLPVEPDNSRQGDSDVMYEPREGVVQSARLALIGQSPHLAGIAYRYRPPGGSTFEVRWASWVGTQWIRETVDAGAFDTFPAIGATHHGSTARVYYIKHPSCDPDQTTTGTVYVGEKRVTADSGGSSDEWRIRRIGGQPGVERLGAITRLDGTDVLYLAAPNLENPSLDPSLAFATLSRSAAPSGASTSADQVLVDSPENASQDGRKNWAFGAPVTVTSKLGTSSGGVCAVDGNTWADYSRWLSARNDPEPAITIPFSKPIQVDEVHIYSGYHGGTSDVVSDFAIDLYIDGEWREVERVTGNTVSPAVVSIDDLSSTDRLRLRVLNMEHPNHLARVYEVEVYSRADAPPLRMSLSANPSFHLFPGGTTQVVAQLANRSLDSVSGELEVDAPDGWTVDADDLGYALNPNDTTSVAFDVTSSPDAASPGEFEITVTAPEHGVENVVDLPIRDGVLLSDDGAPFYRETGAWKASSLPGYGGSGSRYAPGGGGAGNGETATWTPDLTEPGSYRVYVWYPTDTSRATTTARYTVTHAIGSTEIVVNQRENGGNWNLLGTWEFEDGTAGSVKLTAEPSALGYHRASAVRFEPVITP